MPLHLLLHAQICLRKDFFVRLVGISPDKLYALAKHYKTNGLVPLQLRAGGRKNNTASLAQSRGH